MATASTTQQQVYSSLISNSNNVSVLDSEDATVSINIATVNQTNRFLDSAAIVASQVAQSNANVALTANDVLTTHADVAAAAAQVALAVQAKTSAENARDSAAVSSNIYPNVSAGLASTNYGGYFSVPSTNSNEYLTLYRDDGNSATAIQTYPSVAGIEYDTGNTLYVKSNGNDNKNGGSWKNAFKTIEKALAVATALGTPTLIEIGPFSEYYTKGHLDMPDNCVIKAVHRTVFVRPVEGYEQRNVFRMGSGCFLEGVMFEGWQVDDFDNPTEGFAVSFRPGAVITRVPYAHKIAVRALPTWSKIAPPLDAKNGNPLVPRAGGVCLADGAIISQYSIFPNIMTWGATPVLPNGIGYCAKNGGLINAVNAVSIWAHKHFMAIQGGQLILSGCSTQFGDYTMYADGVRNIISPQPSNALTGGSSVYGTIDRNKTTIVTNLLTNIVKQNFKITWTDTILQKTQDDAYLLMQCISWAFQSGNEQPMLDFAKGLFDTAGIPIYISVTKSSTAVTDLYKAAGSYINSKITTVQNGVYNLLVTNYSSVLNSTDLTYSTRDTKTILDAVRRTLITGDESNMISLAKGFFYSNGILAISPQKLTSTIAAINFIRTCLTSSTATYTAIDTYFASNITQDTKNGYIALINSLFDALVATLQNYNRDDALAPYLYSFDYILNEITNLFGVSTTNKTKISLLIGNLKANVTNPTVVQEPSRITAIGHTWTAVLGGVALTKIPPANNKGNIQDSIFESNNAVVIASGQDDQGNALFVGGLQISADTGELSGAPFDQAVRRVAIRSAISGSY